MAWIEQTKKGSIKSGGPQYYLQDLAPNNKDLLRHKKNCPVRLWTPYGVVPSGLVAVSSSVGKVGHDRVQSGRRAPSVADQIATWYNLSLSRIERIEFEDSFDHDCFVIRPSRIKFFAKKQQLRVYPESNPLSFTAGHKSALLIAQIESLKRTSKHDLAWIASQLKSIAEGHSQSRMNVDERDLLRASGALSRLGIELGMYRGKGIDCPDATFCFDKLPPYQCGVEIEEKSSGFLAQHHATHREQRVVVLCMENDEPTVMRGYVDIVELRELDAVLSKTA